MNIYIFYKAAIVQKHVSMLERNWKENAAAQQKPEFAIHLNCCVVAIKSPAIVVSFVFGNYNNVSKLMQ